ncbi:hypothetical protein Hypma_006335 [Hypsizygus marmoreus]|uniref:Uncharacterized protein n=1 Tax=Hypsizygus marmoreus TaxID=39966 RepID=A0A369K318_HYPMA|nr:hypothetical protein Hypma_006335 [Hypsizygus marmoreus]
MPLSNSDGIDELFSEPDDHDDTHHHHSETSNDSPSPWLDNPEPKSELYPDLTARLKCFTNRRRKMNKGEGKWPYRLYPPDPTKILFFEFRGYGPPPKDIGNPGDIYVDLTPSPGPNLCIYLHDKEAWVRNYWNLDPNITEFPLHWHPLLNDRFLWGTEASGFMWFTGDKLRQEGCHRVLEDHDPSSMIAAALKYDFCGDPWVIEMTEDNLSRKKEEEARRTRRRRRWLADPKNNVPLSPEQLREQEERRERRRKLDEESRKKMEDRDRQRVHRRSLKGEPSSAATRAALEQYRRDGLPVPCRRTRKRKRRGSDASGGRLSSGDENEDEPCYIPRSMLKRKRGPTPGEDNAQPVPQRRQRSRTVPEAEKPSTSKPPQKARSRTSLPSTSGSQPVASSSQLPPTTPTRHVHTPPISGMYLKPMTPVRLLSSSPMVFMASREDESDNDDADSSHAPTCPDMDGSQLGEDFDIELKEREREREVEDHWSSRHVSEVDDDHGHHRPEGERYQLLMNGPPQPILEADAETTTGAMGEDAAHQESVMAEAELQTEITEDVSTDGDDERIGVEVEHVEKALLQNENNAENAENEEEEDEVDGRSQEAQAMTQNTDRGPSFEEQGDNAYDEDASTVEKSAAQEEYVDSPLDVEDERIRETGERVSQQEEEKDKMGIEMDDMQRHIPEGESHWIQRDADETDEEPEENVGVALDPSHGTNSLIFPRRSQSTEAEKKDKTDDVLEEDSHGDNGRQQVIAEDQETQTSPSHDAEEMDAEVEEPTLVEQHLNISDSASPEAEPTSEDEDAQVRSPSPPRPSTEDVLPGPMEDFDSVLQKAKDVHDFLSRWNPDIVRERDTLRARVADLSMALEKEKAAHCATQLHLGLARSAARASDDTIRQKSHQANALRQSLASQMELAQNQRQEADAQRERADNCVRSLGDVTRQRDELSASLIEAQQVITRLSASLTEEQEHLERAQALIREKDAKINGALQVAEKLHKTLFGLGKPEGEDNGRIQHP